MLSPHPNRDIESDIISSFSRHVRSYDRNAQLQKSMAERLAVLLPDPLPKRILEIGCGTGIFTRHLLANPVDHLVLNDISPAMIEHLKTQLSLPRHHKILTGNAEKLHFDPVDLIAANAVFQWFRQPADTLGKLAQSLCPGGKLVFSTFGPRTLEEFRTAAEMQSPALLYSQNKWKAMIRKAGLTLAGSDSEVRKSFAPSALSLLKNLQQIGAAPLKMVTSGRLRGLIRAYDQKFSTPQGVYATWELFYFSAGR